MAFCTILEIRNCDKKLESTSEVPDPAVTERIATAENVIYTDLSPVIDEVTLGTIGESSKSVNMLAIYKSVELTLVKYYGATRQVDTVSDIEYWRKKYDSLMEKILEGEIKIVAAGTDYTPANYPKINASASRLKLYPRKGIAGFTNDGADAAYRDENN